MRRMGLAVGTAVLLSGILLWIFFGDDMESAAQSQAVTQRHADDYRSHQQALIASQRYEQKRQIQLQRNAIGASGN